jgi:hypothetical protein
MPDLWAIRHFSPVIQLSSELKPTLERLSRSKTSCLAVSCPFSPSIPLSQNLSITQISFKSPSPLVFPSPKVGVRVASLKELGKEFATPLLLLWEKGSGDEGWQGLCDLLRLAKCQGLAIASQTPMKKGSRWLIQTRGELEGKRSDGTVRSASEAEFAQL